MTSVLRCRDLTVRLDGRAVLRGIDLDLDARTIAVVGDNGSGKSTFARVVAGLIRRDAGDLAVRGLDPDRDAAELGRRVALVLSNPDAQIVMPVVADDVGFSLRAERLPRAERAERVARALARFGLTDLAERPAHDLSGGQKQLLALCGAFVREPDLVVADEPTAYLDARNARRVADHLLADTGHALLLVTHDLALARRCDAAVLFADGVVSAAGVASEVIDVYERALRC
ncbi:MAG: energy-coupling factor ABC transporter ATP-binding protein [Microbacterium sp. 71-36]|uniref:energy-coupling factor ABC transporter ATP-binding protein n=1 Tax=unclassified Microbacterium TaxID=2609290 RepID=UPI000929407C|nr:MULTISPECIES: ABC transporter ATP-binding protein [unclassified Microbacterium]MBN9212356.1 ABC transporter ATP-binding protein [Microbacterium sp.]OJV78200.1 MAG: energy-coupling factor ABC transporter ATP-binding protein [Microbacterium sp. 71-36]